MEICKASTDMLRHLTSLRSFPYLQVCRFGLLESSKDCCQGVLQQPDQNKQGTYLAEYTKLANPGHMLSLHHRTAPHQFKDIDDSECITLKWQLHVIYKYFLQFWNPQHFTSLLLTCMDNVLALWSSHEKVVYIDQPLWREWSRSDEVRTQWHKTRY